MLNANSSLIPAAKSLSSFNDAYLSKHKDSPQHIHSGLKVRALLGPATKSRNEGELIASIDLPSSDLQDAQNALSLLAQWQSTQKTLDGFFEKARKRWPQATMFAPAVQEKIKVRYACLF